MDPVTSPPTPGATPVFQGAEADAQILRQRLNDLFNLAPEGSVIQDPQRRAKLATSAEKVVELTAQLGALQVTVPGRVGRILGPLVTGLEKQPGTGRVIPTAGTAGNFLPSPLGFLDPTAVGLKRNFYLPAGSTELIPPAFDRIGLGLGEQRSEDVVRRADIIQAEAASRRGSAQTAIAGESESTLRDIAAGRGGLSRAGVVIASSGVDLPTLQSAAQAELNRLAGVGVPSDPGGLPAAASVVVSAAQAATASPVTSGADTGNQPDPATIRPVNDAGKRHEQTAQGIARELIHERADP